MQEEVRIDGTGDILEFLKLMNASFTEARKQSENFQDTATGQLNNLSKSAKSFNMTNVHQQIQNLNEGFQDLNGPGTNFNASLKDLSALTGTTGAELDKLGASARESAKEFGGSAAASIETYKTILGSLGPGIAKSRPALKGMERDVQLLSKTMGNDTAGAVDALTTSMLQYNVDLTKPIAAQKEMTNMMNVMAAAAQEGSAEVPSISAALKVSGVAAYQSKLSFVELNAAIQAMAKGGKQGSEAGTALRNVLGKMAGEDVIPKEAAEKLKKLGVDMSVVSDTTLPFTTRLRELKKAQGDATIMAQLFGVENSNAANILLQYTDFQDDLQKKITGTNSAQEQANVVMESASEKLARMKARIDDAKIAFFEATGGMTAYLGPVTEVMRTMSSFAPIYSAAKTAATALFTVKGRVALATKLENAATMVNVTATKIVTAAQWLWNAALSANPIGLVVAGIALLTAGVLVATRAFRSSTAAEEANAAVKARVADKTADESAEVHLLFARLRDAKKGTDEYNSALKDLDTKYPGMIEKYNLHKGAVEDINRAEKDLIRTIKERAEAEAELELYKENVKRRQEAELKGPSMTQQILGSIAGPTGAIYLNASEISDIKDTEEELMKRILSRQKKQKKNTSTSVPEETTSLVVSPKGYASKSGSNESKPESQGVGQVKSVNVHIENFGGGITIVSNNITEGVAELKRKLTEALMGSIRDFEVSM